ncbi:MAG TPA: hypothetical protein VIU93_06965 [Gallionellaceae bacterium]
MDAAAKTYPDVGRRKPEQRNQPKDYGWTMYLIIITLAMLAGYFISYDKLYKPGDKIGYNMGLTGGIMMLTLLIYPLRKRFRFMKGLGLLPRWFQWHMVFGVLGPTLIMFHSTFYIGSVNAGVALVCMMLVSGSGIFGRFFYTKIHNGLYGRQASYKQLQAELDGAGDVKSIFSFAPEIQQKLVQFRDSSLKSSAGGKPWQFISVGVRARWLSATLVRELEDLMYADAHEKNWNDAQMKRLDEMFFQNKQFVENYLKTLQDVAQFSTYEKLFSLWHIFHMPLAVMLVFSAIWHVIAVHMY